MAVENTSNKKVFLTLLLCKIVDNFILGICQSHSHAISTLLLCCSFSFTADAASSTGTCQYDRVWMSRLLGGGGVID